MRTRSTILSTAGSAQMFAHDRLDGSSPWGGTTELKTVKSGLDQLKVIVDTEIPGFKALKSCNPSKALPFNPLDIRTDGTNYVPGRIALSYNKSTGLIREVWGSELFTSDTLPYPEPSNAQLTAAVNAAAADARASAFDALTFIGELPELFGLYRTCVGRLAHIILLVRGKAKSKLAQKKARNWPQAEHQAWLEYRYAWMPLVYSLQDLVKALSQNKTGLVRKRSTFSIPVSDSVIITDPLFDSGFANFTMKEEWTGTITVRGFAIADWQDGAGGAFGFDPLNTAWELITLSFVVDWFFQIGSWLQAISPVSKANLVVSGVSISYDLVHSAKSTCIYPGRTQHGITITGSSSSEVTRTIKRYVRIPMSPELPGWNPQLNPKRMADALALLIGALSGKSKT